MLQLENHSPFQVGMFVLPDVRGVETLVVVIKASFHVAAGPQLAKDQRPITLADEYWREPGVSSLRYPGEVHPAKPGTDVLVLGEACAPRERPVSTLDVAMSVAGRRLFARVHGDRHWTEGLGGVQPSHAQPFVRVPMIYERAYGGREAEAQADGSYAAETCNPVGLGFLGGQPPKQLLGYPVPNLDDPQQPLTRLGQTPPPTCFGAVAPGWQPRMSYAGTYDERWRKTRAPHLPTDFDPRFFQVAPTTLHFADGLRGGEVIIEGMHPRGRCEFALPVCRFDLGVRLAGRDERLQPELDLVLVEPTDEHLTLTWRAVVITDKRTLDVERVRIELTEMQGASARGT